MYGSGHRCGAIDRKRWNGQFATVRSDYKEGCETWSPARHNLFCAERYGAEHRVMLGPLIPIQARTRFARGAKGERAWKRGDV